MLDFYVYEHWRPDKNEPFYIGKGRKQRVQSFERKHNPHYDSVVRKLIRLGLRIQVRIIHISFSETEAFALEKTRIAYWRSCGVQLTNKTNGGEGTSGLLHTDEQKLSKSLRMKGSIRSPETRAKMSAAQQGKIRQPLTSEHRASISAALLKKNHKKNYTPEYRHRISAAMHKLWNEGWRERRQLAKEKRNNI